MNDNAFAVCVADFVILICRHKKDVPRRGFEIFAVGTKKPVPRVRRLRAEYGRPRTLKNPSVCLKAATVNILNVSFSKLYIIINHQNIVYHNLNEKSTFLTKKTVERVFVYLYNIRCIIKV